VSTPTQLSGKALLDKDVFDKLHAMEKETAERLNTIREMIRLGQKTCAHQMGYSGRDSHHDYYECKICGYEERDG
jgi:rubrerythrin